MRVLLYINLLAIVIISGALAQMYQGMPLPWAKDGVWAGDLELPAHIAQKPAVAEEPQPKAIVTSQPAEKLVAKTGGNPLRVLTEGAYPPFNGRNAAGKLVGYDIDMVQAICARLERPCEIETRNWKALLVALKRGEADMVVASMLIPGEGDYGVKAGKEIAFSSAYYQTPGHFAGRRDAKALSAASLATQVIAVQAGSTHEAFLKARFAGAKILSVQTLDEAEAALIDGKAGLVFGDRNALLNWMKHGGGEGCCRMVGGDYDDPAYFGAGAGMAFRATDTKLREDVNRIIAEIKRDGTELNIARPYFGQTIR